MTARFSAVRYAAGRPMPRSTGRRNRDDAPGDRGRCPPPGWRPAPTPHRDSRTCAAPWLVAPVRAPKLKRSGVMGTGRPPAAPEGTGRTGRRLWRRVVTQYALDPGEVTLLGEACRVADACAELQAIVDREGLLVDGRPSAALLELRQQRLLLGRLLVALRFPDADAEVEVDDPPGRPQRRPARGLYGRSGVA